MAANVFNTERAVHASVKVVRAFVGLRLVLASNAELSRRLDGLEESKIVSSRSCSTRSDNSCPRRFPSVSKLVFARGQRRVKTRVSLVARNTVSLLVTLKVRLR